MQGGSKGAGGKRFWVNGRFVSESRATLPVLDRGLLFGDALYEVVRFYRKRVFLLDRHMDRLFREAEIIGLPVRFTAAEVARAVEGLAARSAEPGGLVLVEWTRGDGERRLAPSPGFRGNLFAVRLPLPRLPRRYRNEGAPVLTLPDERWQGTDLKSTNLLAAVLARSRAEREGCHEAILHRGRGPGARITEGTSSTVFLVRKGVVITPAVRGLLPGITREVVVGVVREEGLPLEERTVRLAELFEADEAFLTATSAEILPIGAVNGRPPARSAPGPVTRLLIPAFRRVRDRILRKTPPARK
ncbi:MAG: aminotransferase class IV [Candidatus Eisenbacteria bacterium]|nr:aminotransferase class IV [Candidatus Eisenbacteria bacterium]